jgi:hypothetical protein
VARSIRDWFADHSRDIGSSEDEVTEAPAPWDVRAAGTATTRSARRDASVSGGGRSRRSFPAGDDPGSRTERRSGKVSAGADRTPTTVQPVPSRVRRAILDAVRANPSATSVALAAHLTRQGTPVTTAQVAAVRNAPQSPLGTGSQARRDPSTQEKVAKICKAAQTHPHLGVFEIHALLRSRGVTVTKEQVAGVLAQRLSALQRGRPGVRATDLGPTTRVGNAAKPEKAPHETPLCPSCGARPSIYGICRCS